MEGVRQDRVINGSDTPVPINIFPFSYFHISDHTRLTYWGCPSTAKFPWRGRPIFALIISKIIIIAQRGHFAGESLSVFQGDFYPDRFGKVF